MKEDERKLSPVVPFLAIFVASGPHSQLFLSRTKPFPQIVVGAERNEEEKPTEYRGRSATRPLRSAPKPDET